MPTGQGVAGNDLVEYWPKMAIFKRGSYSDIQLSKMQIMLSSLIYLPLLPIIFS